MKDVLHFVYEYRRLLARRDLLAGKLDSDSAERLEALERLFAPDPDEGAVDYGGKRRQHSRCEVQLWATLKAGGRVHSVRVVNVGGGGMRVEPAPAIRQGERAVVRVRSQESGREYAYPVQAQWIHRAQDGSSMGLPFVGVPLQLGTPQR